MSPRRGAPVATSFPAPVAVPVRPLSADRGPVASRREQLARDTLRHLGAGALGETAYTGSYSAGGQVQPSVRGNANAPAAGNEMYFE